MDIGPVTITQTFSTYSGDFTILLCSVNISPDPLPTNVPYPTFKWFYGPNKAVIPARVTQSATIKNGSTYSSSLHFSTLQSSHSGVYSCRLGGNDELLTNIELFAQCDGKHIKISVTPNLM